MNVLLEARLLVLDKGASRFTRVANFDKFVTNIHDVIYYQTFLGSSQMEE